jgi:hypothetical protein
VMLWLWQNYRYTLISVSELIIWKKWHCVLVLSLADYTWLIPSLRNCPFVYQMSLAIP